MPVLTGLAPDPTRPDFRVVELDRGRFASLPGEALTPLGLAIGAAVPRRVMDRLQELADIETAHRAALRSLARRGHGLADLRRRLLHRQHPPGAVDVALGRLAAAGLLDDTTFARDYAAAKAARGRGPARIVRDLLGQGVDRSVAEGAVRAAVVAEGVDVAAAARRLAEQRARQLEELPPLARRRRLTAFLQRRGYQGPAVNDLIKELCG